MIIPLRHENTHGRRWPVVTIGIIALNVAIFLVTHWTMDKQAPELSEVKVHLVLLAAMHPELQIHGKAEQFIASIQTSNPALWKEAKNPNRDVQDGWDARIRMLPDEPAALQQEQDEMDNLSNRFEQLDTVSIISKYAYTPGRPTLLSLITANFLHGGWLHLIGNMWFLWLAGAVLEDTWGRLIYPAFYMIAGVLALQVHAMANPGSMVPTLGASGAIAGLMGAFLVRFPNTKVEMGWLMLYRFYRFKMAAYWLLPFWLVTEVFYGSLSGQAGGVAHWAHVGGFVFGGLIALGVRASGLEQKAEKVIQEKISWVSHPLLAEANEQMEKGELDAAIANLRKLLQENPDSIEAYRMLQNIYWHRSDVPAHCEALERIIALELKANDVDGASQTFQDFRNAGGKLSASLWIDFCRQIETRPDQDRAAEEYKELARAYPGEKQGLLAQMAAGRIYLKRLNRPTEALQWYKAAQASTVPHSEWQGTIERGIAEATKVLSPVAAPTPVS